MRKALTMLGAIVAVALSSLLGAPAAMAYTINCSDVPSSLTVYPYNGTTGSHPAQICGTTPTSKGSGMAGQLYALSVSMPDAYAKLDVAHARFYIFNTVAEYDSFFDERKASPPAGTVASDWDHDEPSVVGAALGVTYRASGVPKFTAIFVNSQDGYTIDQFATVGHITAHEAGHWLDYLYRSGTVPLSASVMFSDLLNKNTSTQKGDWTNLNNTAFNPQCGTGGIFNGRTDQSTIPGTYHICTGGSYNSLPLNGIYSGGTSKVVLTVGLSGLFKNNAEIFASEVAYWAGTTDDAPHGGIVYFDSGRFGCTKLLIGNMVQNGTLPTAIQMGNVAVTGGVTGSAKCPTSGSGWTLP